MYIIAYSMQYHDNSAMSLLFLSALILYYMYAKLIYIRSSHILISSCMSAIFGAQILHLSTSRHAK